MIKKWIYYTSVLATTVFISFSFRSIETEKANDFALAPANQAVCIYPSESTQDYLNPKIPYTGKFFIGYKEALAFKESQGKYSKEIDRYSGKLIGGVLVTESGILAAAHLGGVGSVKKFLKSHGKRDIRDNYGSSIKGFMKKFGGYETSAIVADSNARVRA